MCRHSPSHEIGSCAVWLLRILKKSNKGQHRKIFKTRADFPQRKWKAQWEAVAYCWATTQAVGLTCCRTIRFQYDGVWIWSGFPCIYIRNWPRVYSIPTCAKFDLRRIFWNVTTAYVVKRPYVGYVPIIASFLPPC